MVLIKDTAVSVADARKEGGVGFQLGEPQGRGNVAKEMFTPLRIPFQADLELRKCTSYITIPQAMMSVDRV